MDLCMPEINDLDGLSSDQLQRLADQIASRLKPKRKQPKGFREVLSLTEEAMADLFRAVHGGASVRDVAIFEVAYHRGLRVSEVGKLRIGHVRIEARRLYVERLKGSMSAEFPLTDREVKALRAWLRIRGTKAGPLFPSRNHRPISRRRLDELMKFYGAAADLPMRLQHFHCLRHSCGQHLYDRGVDLGVIQDHLGHVDIRNTTIYARVSDKKRVEIAEKLVGW
jgi:type 1 fimbriae regulatory protein FimB